jgi:hypothetical protein
MRTLLVVGLAALVAGEVRGQVVYIERPGPVRRLLGQGDRVTAFYPPVAPTVYERVVPAAPSFYGAPPGGCPAGCCQCGQGRGQVLNYYAGPPAWPPPTSAYGFPTDRGPLYSDARFAASAPASWPAATYGSCPGGVCPSVPPAR